MKYLKNIEVILFLSLLLFSVSKSTFAQLSVQTLSSVRHGKLPNSREGKIPTYYSDMIVEYRYKWFLAGARGEGFNSPDLKNKYDHISQRYLEFSYSWINARIGNVYGIFGKGLILRGFELPGFIYESQAFRTQQRVIRDFDGIKVELNPGPVSVTFINGKTIQPLLPPTFEDRRFGDLTGAQGRLSLPGSVMLGTAYLKHKTTFETKILTRFLSWNADNLFEKLGSDDLTFDLYAEYATEGNKGFGKFKSDDPHALYMTGNFTWDIFGASIEYKDYHKFDFGINDPPPLVRENTEVLLNRSTHVLNAFAEEGYQFEFYLYPFSSARFVANYSIARNKFSKTFSPIFQERYVGFEFIGDPWSVRAFFDNGEDGIVSEVKRITTGFAPDYSFSSGTTIGLDFQWQKIQRASQPFFDYQLTNFFSAFKIQDWHNLSFAINSERSTDPYVTNSKKYFVNTSIGWQPVHQVNLQLFVGKRRGGTACDHGYCIEVLDFEGVELRMETHW